MQTAIHHPTDSGLLGDGVRVLTRLMQRARPLVHAALTDVRQVFRSRVRSARRVLQQLHRVRCCSGEDAARQREAYAQLQAITRRVVRQAERVHSASGCGEQRGKMDRIRCTQHRSA